MNYYEFLFTTLPDKDYQQDLLINALGDIGFETFEDIDFGFKAYISSSTFSKQQLDACLKPFYEQFTFSYEVNLIPGKNWNAVWESNFEPLVINDKIYVRATFHKPEPGFPYEIIIDPKMAFGTGHHQTTAMMLAYVLDEECAGKRVLDMGCGTGILAVMAAKAGAASIIAIDNDPVCYDSVAENVKLNNAVNITALCGSQEVIPAGKFDLIFANINRNVLLDQMEIYANLLTKSGALYISGFYEDPDLDILIKAARNYGLRLQTHKTDKDWAAAKFTF